ncbi:MAG: phage antirepressor KilAC domain-containing protein [Prevotella sp.]|nr:phage antirepressor KilAC domain-containing protein [Prevotella sp.]
MSNIQIFNSPRFGAIRTSGTPQMPMFCLADVCNAIGIANPRNVKSRLDEDDVHLVDTPTSGGMQQITYVTESGLYDVIIRSDSEQAKPFRKWVTSEVLPSIRKHGAYMTGTTIDSIIADPDNGIRLLQALKEEREQRKLVEDKVLLLEEVTKIQAPKVRFAEAVTGTETNILIRDLAKLIQQNGYNIGEKRLYQWLRDNDYLCKYGQNYNRPMQRYVEQGLFFLKEGVHSENGIVKSNFTTMVTGKGQEYFINKFIGNESKMV